MATVRARSILASSRPLEAYGGIQLSEDMIRQLAEATGLGDIPMTIGHDTSRPVTVSVVQSGTTRGEDGYLRAWVEFDVDEEPWATYQEELRAAGIRGLGAMSITFMQPLDGEEVVATPIKVAGDAYHFTDDEIRAAAVILQSLDPSAAGAQLYQLSATPALRVVFDLALDFVMNIGPNIAASVIYDAAKSLLRRGGTNTFDLAFKESRRGARTLKVTIKVSTDAELRTALENLPAVIESGATGTFSHQRGGYIRVDGKTAVDASEGAGEVGTIEERSEATQSEPPMKS